VFKDAKGKFDGRIFIGVMLGLGSVSGAAIKFWWSISDSVPPFWLWAIPAAFLGIGFSMWVQRRREQRGIRERLERSARVDALRSRRDAPPDAAQDINTID
jgi:hypothetical protein